MLTSLTTGIGDAIVDEDIIPAPSFDAIVAKFESGETEKGQSSSSESGSKYSEPLIRQELDVTEEKGDNKSRDTKSERNSRYLFLILSIRLSACAVVSGYLHF